VPLGDKPAGAIPFGLTTEGVMLRPIGICTLIAIAALLAAIPSARAQARPEAGRLTCRLGPSVGLIIASRQRMTCVFRNAATGRTESYVGRIGRLGLDVGITAGGRMVWAVYARTRQIAPRALVGDYVGASGDIALGFGVGANALVGGSNRTVALQPLSLEGQVGVNLALGVARLILR
jgi:hypothetical protein